MRCGYGRDAKITYFSRERGAIAYECVYESVEDSQYCIFHDPKYAISHAQQALTEFYKIVQNLKDNEPLLCIGFTFPANVHVGNIEKAYFDRAHFLGKADFSNAYFNQVSFRDVVFEKVAEFHHSSFDEVTFINTTFHDSVAFGDSNLANITFHKAIFSRDANFMEAVFSGMANFECTFDTASFRAAHFKSYANFHNTTFKNTADFRLAIFESTANFPNARFHKTDFSEAIFRSDANFTKTAFMKSVRFIRAQFSRCDFSRSIFYSNANFKRADFSGEVEFFHTTFPIMGYIFSWDDIPEHTEEFKRFMVSNFGKRYEDIQLKENNSFADTFDINSDQNEKLGTLSLDTMTGDILIDLWNPKRKVKLSSRKVKGIVNAYSTRLSQIPIKFDYSTFRQRTRFVGRPHKMLDLSSVSFRGVELSNLEFHNVKWIKRKKIIHERDTIIDEILLDKHRNYEEVSKIYNQLRKNYESRLLFTEASNFFVGEMEAIRKSGRTYRKRFLAAPYLLYKWIAMYGENALVPLAIWTPVIITAFAFVRFSQDMCSPEQVCSTGLEYYITKFLGHLGDSFAAYFQVPKTTSNIDIVERIISAPILGTVFIALKRKFERRK